MVAVGFSQFFFLFRFWLCCKKPIAWLLIPTCKRSDCLSSAVSPTLVCTSRELWQNVKKQNKTWSLSRRPYCAGACLIARSAALFCCLFTVLFLPFSVVSLPEVTCPPKSSLPPPQLSIKAMAECAEERKQDASRWFPLQSVQRQSILKSRKKQKNSTRLLH